jgi:WD40 repeat protein
MGFDMDLSMQSGIAKSGCVVALLSARYGTKPDPAKDNCLKELRWAKGEGKPIVACLADPTPGWFPAAGGEVAALVGTHHLFPDLRAAAAIDWRADVSAAEREVLTKAPLALPKVLQLVREVLDSTAELVVAPPLPPPLPPAPAVKGRCIAMLKGGGDVRALAVARSSGWLVSSNDSHLSLWWTAGERSLSHHASDEDGFAGIRSFAGKARGIACLDGLIATAGGDSFLVEVWDTRGRLLFQLKDHTDNVRCVVALTGEGFEDSGESLFFASGSSDQTVRVWDAAGGTLIATLCGHEGKVFALAALPNGALASGSDDNTVRFWDVAARTCTKVLEHTGGVHALAAVVGLDSDDVRFASGGEDGAVFLWNVSRGFQVASLSGHADWVRSLADLPPKSSLRPHLLASGSDDKTVRIWDVNARSCVALLEGHKGWVAALAALPDGCLASGSISTVLSTGAVITASDADPYIRVWALTEPGTPEDRNAEDVEQRCLQVARGPESRALNAHCVATCSPSQQQEGGFWFASSGDLAVVEGVGLVSSGSGHICAWAQGADRGLWSTAGEACRIAALPGGRFAATAGWDTKLVEVWDAGTGQRLHQLRGHTENVECVAAHPGGFLASGSVDKTVRIWNAATGALVATLEGHTNSVLVLGVLPDGLLASHGNTLGNLLASGSDDATVRIWNLATGAHVATLEGHTDSVRVLAALPDGRLASGSDDNTTRLWNVATRTCTQVLQHPGRVGSFAVLDDGRLASASLENNICDVYTWSTTGGVQKAVLRGHQWYVTSLAALPNGLLASGSADGTVRVWDLRANSCVAVLRRHYCEPLSGGVLLALLPDGRLASAGDDNLIRIWSLTVPGTPEDAAAALTAARVSLEPCEPPTVAPGPSVAFSEGGENGGGGAPFEHPNATRARENVAATEAAAAGGEAAQQLPALQQRAPQ